MEGVSKRPAMGSKSLIPGERCPTRRLPANSQFFLPSAIGLIWFSTQLTVAVNGRRRNSMRSSAAWRQCWQSVRTWGRRIHRGGHHSHFLALLRPGTPLMHQISIDAMCHGDSCNHSAWALPFRKHWRFKRMPAFVRCRFCHKVSISVGGHHHPYTLSSLQGNFSGRLHSSVMLCLFKA
jgi:hypothetical protein